MNSMNCMVLDAFGGYGYIGIWLSMGTPSKHNIVGVNFAMHVHVLERHVHCI